MLDINFIRENPEKLKEACKNKNINVDVGRILALDKQKRALMTEIEALRAEQNKISRQSVKTGFGEDDGDPKDFDNQSLIGQAKELKAKIKELCPELEKVDAELKSLLLVLPNIPFEDVPVGKDDSENVVLRKVGSPHKSLFHAPKDYMELATALDLIDTERAGKVAGSRFGYIKNQLALLQFAMVNYGLDTLRKEGFIPVLPPVMLKEEMARGTGYFEGTDSNEAYFFPEDKLYLIGTSEQSLVAMHAGEVLGEKDLPKRYVGYSTCFRREAGSYGKDTKGILRVHQFDKLEMVILSTPEQSKKEHELILRLEEKLMKGLGLPYQVIGICTGDMGRPAAKKYDIEAWMPSENKYRETHSNSNCTDFQARRLNIRYKDKEGAVKFVHTLNGTVFSMRPLLMIMENFQQKDGSIKVPKVLQKYCGFKVIK